MVNEFSGNGDEPSVDGAKASGGIDWNQRAGPIFKYGLAVGFILILLGGLSFNLALTNVFLEILVICSGLSIILGAFGSTAKATIPGQSMVLVGVAAIAVSLFFLIMKEMDNRYMNVQIGGDVKGSQIDLVGDESYLGAFQKQKRAFNFVIFGKEIHRPVLSLYITLPDETELSFECIHKDNLRRHLASGRMVVWRFDKKEGTLMNVVDGHHIADLGPCRGKAEPIGISSSPQESPKFSLAFPLISIAYAQEKDLATQDTSVLIKQLDASASYLRRDARSQLAKKGITVVRPLLVTLSQEPLSYRSRLGVIVALTEMMRENKGSRREIINKITHEDLALLVDASADEDRTVRIYASEFLYDLGDPRTIPLCMAKFPVASENGRYSLLLVIKGAVPFVPKEERSKVVEDVTALKSKETPKTNNLIDSIVELAK